MLLATLFSKIHMYLLNPVVFVTTFANSISHVNVPCYEFETILNRHSRSCYLHTFDVFQDCNWKSSRLIKQLGVRISTYKFILKSELLSTFFLVYIFCRSILFIVYLHFFNFYFFYIQFQLITHPKLKMFLILKRNPKCSSKSWQVIKNILSNSKRNQIDHVKV